MTNNPPSPSLSAEPPIMTSQMHPDGGPLNKGVHNLHEGGELKLGIMAPLESPLHENSHASLTQNKVAPMNQISDLTKTDEEHAIVELDMPTLSASNIQGPENFHFTDNNNPSNPDSATETFSGKGATEIPLNDGIVEMNSDKVVAAKTSSTKNKQKSREKDQLVSELEAVSHMLDSEEANGESEINPTKDNIKGKLLDIDGGQFHDDNMHKVDLAGVLNEDDTTITDEIRDAQGMRGVKLTDGVTDEAGNTKDRLSDDYGHKKNKFMRYVTPKAQRRVATAKKNNGTGLTDEDEKMINDILEQSKHLEKTQMHSYSKQDDSDQLTERKGYTPTVPSRMKKLTEKKKSVEKQKCHNNKCHNLKDAPKHKEPVPPTKPPRGDSNPVEQENNTEDTVSSKIHQQQVSSPPSIKLKFHDLGPKNNGKKPGNPVSSKFSTEQKNTGHPSTWSNLIVHSKLSAELTHQTKSFSKVEKTNDKMGLLFSRGAPTNKSLIHPHSTAAEDITRECFFLFLISF